MIHCRSLYFGEGKALQDPGLDISGCITTIKHRERACDNIYSDATKTANDAKIPVTPSNRRHCNIPQWLERYYFQLDNEHNQKL